MVRNLAPSALSLGNCLAIRPFQWLFLFTCEVFIWLKSILPKPGHPFAMALRGGVESKKVSVWGGDGSGGCGEME